MSDPTRVTAAVLIIGNEILSGRTKDANLAFLGTELNLLGIQLLEARVVADIEVEIIDALDACRAKYDYVFTTGGIGPTHDDITSACVAKAFGQKLIRHPEAERILRERMTQMGVEATEARLKMAETPEFAELVDNPVSGAPGFRVENVYVMAGIPRIMQAMFEGAKPHLKRGVILLSVTVGSFVPEGQIATELSLLQDAYPDMDIGSYPFFFDGKPGSNLVLRGPDQARLDEAAGRLGDLIRNLGQEPVEGGVEVPKSAD
ncbi:MAG: competence/damage-inducible protein A [Rhodospirillaceae bacterium]|jgi:molybdenum cofactor synthesis domain-containing protein|nr:competence/damage-inducible protein A [Rhodospirillaceae bacterium]MBT5945187.1 competence/damage-inducible protein A [Rhodospirillaceae bacterium]MBT6403006.1 competence/damage-inducible protein A [Rhodospirillaceae bacterium]MBT6534794.1 competence/damage-inducible protein A [Rhodospirillaceae bacterium]MBT7361662.1 competence/damage-inducible protein A [Rhodospirillaceae bacterium]